MVHRTTWIAAPIIALVVFGTAAGWWGIENSRQKAAFAAQLGNSYEASFSGLQSDTSAVHAELGKALITADAAAFRARLRQIAKLAFVAADEAGHLPSGLLPDAHVQQLLSSIGTTTETWLTDNQVPTNPNVVRKLQAFERDTEQLQRNLEGLHQQVLTLHPGSVSSAWVQTAAAAIDRNTRLPVVRNFRAVDHTTPPRITALRSQTTAFTANASGATKVSDRNAQSRLARFIGVNPTAPWHTQLISSATGPAYQVTGPSALGDVYGLVEQRGGAVISFHVDHAVPRWQHDLADEEPTAAQWLARHGLSNMTLGHSHQWEGTAYYEFTPTFQRALVPAASVVVATTLDNGTIVGYQGQSYIEHRIVTPIADRRFSTSELGRKLNSAFHVRETRTMIGFDASGHALPATAFYGTRDGHTYRVVMNAHTGRELKIEQLS